MKCPCGSQKEYLECCGLYHKGVLAPTAEALMRSRYSAYVLQKVDYLLMTLHPDHEDFKKPLRERRQQILLFCKNTVFKKLEILEVVSGEEISTVTFRVFLAQKKKDFSFMEKSIFKKENDRWYYLKADSLKEN